MVSSLCGKFCSSAGRSVIRESKTRNSGIIRAVMVFPSSSCIFSSQTQGIQTLDRAALLRTILLWAYIDIIHKIDNLLDNVWMLQVFQKWYFPDSSTGNSIVFFFKTHLFYGNDFACLGINCLVDHTISTLTELFLLLIFFKTVYWILGWSSLRPATAWC